MDKQIVCRDCNKEFLFSSNEQSYYADMKLFEPKRCPGCRKKKKEIKTEDLLEDVSYFFNRKY